MQKNNNSTTNIRMKQIGLVHYFFILHLIKSIEVRKTNNQM